MEKKKAHKLSKKQGVRDNNFLAFRKKNMYTTSIYHIQKWLWLSLMLYTYIYMIKRWIKEIGKRGNSKCSKKIKCSAKSPYTTYIYYWVKKSSCTIVIREYILDHFKHLKRSIHVFFFSISVLNSTSLRYTLCTIKYTHFNCPFWWVVRKLYSCVFLTTIKICNISINLSVALCPFVNKSLPSLLVPNNH